MGNRYTCKQTFEEWCIGNNRRDLLDLWDYEKNDKLPSEVPARTKAKYYFKCPNCIHESEARRIDCITNKPDHDFYCSQCLRDGLQFSIYNSTIDINEIIGQTFGNLTVLSYDIKTSLEHKAKYFICKCSCGQIKSLPYYKLKTGAIKTCGNKSIHYSGENASGWKGGVWVNNADIRHSSLYDTYRLEVFKKDHFQCIICGTHKDLQAHHIYPFANYLNERLNPEKSCTLCKIHHACGQIGSFHDVYGNMANTPEQLQEYVNSERKKLGIDEYFDVYDYMNDLDSDNLEIDDLIYD